LYMHSPLFVTILLQRVDQSLHPVCGFLLHLGGNVPVDIQGKGDRCMPQILGYGLDRITDPDRVCRISTEQRDGFPVTALPELKNRP